MPSSTVYPEVFSFTKTVAAAGTPERLCATRTPVRLLHVQGLETKTGYVEIQLSGDAAGKGIRFGHGELHVIDFDVIKKNFDASALYVRVDINGNGVQGLGFTA